MDWLAIFCSFVAGFGAGVISLSWLVGHWLSKHNPFG